MRVENQPTDGILEEAHGIGRLASAFVRLTDLDAGAADHRELTPAEGLFLAGLRFEKRRRDWLGGRLAAKRAVARLARLGSGGSDQPDESAIEVLRSPTSEPQVSFPSSAGRPAIQVSISHSGEVAGAVACFQNDGRIGFDLERIDSVDPALYSLAFLRHEMEVIENAPADKRDLAVLSLWTAKEAISKAIGLGLSVCLLDIELAFPDRDFCEGSLPARFAGKANNWTDKDEHGRTRTNTDRRGEGTSSSVSVGARPRSSVFVRELMPGESFTIYTRRAGDYILSLARRESERYTDEQ